MDSELSLHQKYILNCYSNRGIQFSHGKGSFLFDVKGNKYLDFLTNYGVNIFGHSHPYITRSLSRQLKKIITLTVSFENELRSHVSERLINLCGHGLQKIYFANSGAEAVEVALKFSVLATKKTQFISCKESYHGKTLGALSATGRERYRKPFLPLLNRFTFIEFDKPEALEQAITPETAAFIVEPIQGEGGLRVYSKGYLQQVREICDKHNILLILDEIQTGVGRTGTFLASHQEEIDYDIVCIGKGLAGGLPVGATLVSEKIALQIPVRSQTCTFGGSPLVAAGIDATLDLLTPARLQHVRDIEQYFMSESKKIVNKKIRRVCGKGVMLGVEVGKNLQSSFVEKLQKRRILVAHSGDTMIRLLPLYTVTKSQVRHVLTALNEIT